MDQNAAAVLMIGWRLVLGLVAASGLVTTAGVYLLARFTSVFDSYAGERARLLAQFHNLDLLVKQTEKLVTTTETIKARISDEVWDRQMRWKYLRDTYEKLMEPLAQMRISTYKLRRYHEIYHSSQSLDPMAEQRLAEVNEHAKALADFLKVRDTAFLVLSTEVHNMLQSAVSELRTTHTESWDEDCLFNIALIEKAMLLVRQAGRKDLGYED
jgi:hypothetical protein